MRSVSPPRREDGRAPLAAPDVAGFLLERRVLGAGDVVHGGLRVSDRTRLNRVFVVTARGRRPLVVKAGPRVGREAAVLERLHRAGHEGLVSVLPSVILADPARGVLVLESPAEARDLTRHHAPRTSSVLRRSAATAPTPSTSTTGATRMKRTASQIATGIRNAVDVSNAQAAAASATDASSGRIFPSAWR